MTCDSCKYKIGSECHRNPPYVLASSPLGYWPRVSGVEWCGEYVEAEIVPRKTFSIETTELRKPRKKKSIDVVP